jgi:membrane protein
MNPRTKTLLQAIYRLYEHSGFTMAGAVAFSLVVSLFPFCIFLGAVAGLVGGREVAAEAVAQLFNILPDKVAKSLAPEVESIMSNSRIDLLTMGGFVTLFFATSAIETLRAALNGAYRVRETRSYPLCLAISMLFVLISAVSMLVLTWAVVVGPSIAQHLEPSLTRTLLNSSWLGAVIRYTFSALVMGVQLLALHTWLAAGHRSIRQVLPGVALSVVLWLLTAALYSYYLNLNDYSRFYAGLSQLMVALIFFQFTAIIIILGAELNRGLIEFGVIED